MLNEDIGNLDLKLNHLNIKKQLNNLTVFLYISLGLPHHRIVWLLLCNPPY